MGDVRIVRYKTSFSVATIDISVKAALESFNQTLIQPKIERRRGRVIQVPGDEFFIYDKVEDVYYYANGIYDQIQQVIASCNSRARALQTHRVEVTTAEEYEGKDVSFDGHTLNLVEPEGSDFEYQNEIIDYAVDGGSHKILEVQTGKGKTAMGMKSMVRIGKLTLIITKASYVDKWVGDLTGKSYSLSLKPGELIRVKGLSQLDDLIQMGKNDELVTNEKGKKCVKTIIMSSHTLDLWLKEGLEKGSSIHFTELLKTLGVGFVLYDESHQLFRMNYWSWVLLSPQLVMDLSATLVPDASDEFAKHRYAERFPQDCRYNGLEYDQYIDGYSVSYGTRDNKFRTRVNRMKMYNHTEFEKVIMQKPKRQEAYFKMCADILEAWYFKEYKKGQKTLIFFATREMCTRFVEYMKKRKPDFKVTRNIEGDNYDEFLTGDICVSTPGKSGTAVDIPGLVLSLITVVIGKQQANLQILGRTRKVRQWDLTPKAVFLHCQNVQKHMFYLNKRRQIFKGKVARFMSLTSNFEI